MTERTATGAIEGMLAGWRAARPRVALLITANDMNFDHGSGVLMTRIMEEAPPYLHLRAFNHWGGDQSIRPMRAILYNRYATAAEDIRRFTLNRLEYFDIASILVVPFTREDVTMAIAASEATGAPLSLYVMDDNALLNDGIPRHLFERLLGLAERRFVISETMRAAYEPAFGCGFTVLPPSVHPKLMRAAPSPPPEAGGKRIRAVMSGNVWHETWLQCMLDVAAGSDLDIRWHLGAKDPSWLSLDSRRLEAAHITVVRDSAPEAIARDLESAALALIPSADGHETDGHAAAIARLSLPSKIPFIMASAGTPILVLHDAPSGAADFVRAHDVGETCAYDRDAIAAAIARLCEPSRQRDIRQRAFALAPTFSSRGVYARLMGR